MAAPKRPLNPLVKVAVALVAVAGVAFLFWHSVRDSRAQPYRIAAADLERWTLALDRDANPAEPYLVLRPPPAVVNGLLDQLFKRAMESLVAPAAPGIPLLLKSEYARAFEGRVPPEQLLAAARSAGLERMPLAPRCLGYRRRSDPRVTRQLYFVLFDAPALVQFRHQLQQMLGIDGIREGMYDPSAMSPALLVAVSNSTFTQWLPLRADPSTDCVAPIEVAR